MQVWFEYKNMSFEKVDGVWVHKDIALPGDFGDIYDKPASAELAEKVELAHQVYLLETKLHQKEMPKDVKEVKVNRKVKDMELDFTKPLDKSMVNNLPKSKKNNSSGMFNPFKVGL